MSPRIVRPSGASLVVRNAAEVCLPDRDGPGITRVPNGALWIERGFVRWVGPDSELPSDAKSAPVHDAGGGAVLPALVDCHTHLVYGGDRVLDFVERSKGTDYTQIAAKGGGIMTTVRATREASDEVLFESARARMQRRLEYGIGTSEIKSGYGLTYEHELRMLKVVRRLKDDGWDVEGTLLAAHVVPPGVNRKEYVDEIVEKMIPEVSKKQLARFVDVFVETGAYNAMEAKRIFEAARRHALGSRVHADQLTPGGGAELAAAAEAVSADHLEHISAEGIRQLKDSKTVATLLPGAMMYLGDRPWRLGRKLVEAGIDVAVATDANPGSSPTHNLPLMGTLAASQLGLTAEEALRAITFGGARALQRDDIGHLEAGARARFLVLDHPDCRALLAAYGEPIIREVVLADRA